MENEDEIVNVFDIETTGLTGSNQVVCFTYGGIQKSQSKNVDEHDLLSELGTMVSELPKGLVVTFNGQPRYGPHMGFDLPLIRTRYLVNNIPEEFPFSSMEHLDLIDLLGKYYTTQRLLDPEISHLTAPEVTQLVHLCDMHPLKTKEANIKQLSDPILHADLQTKIKEFVTAHTKPKYSPGRSLDSAFKLFCPNADEELLNEEISGEDVPQLFDEWKKSGNDSKMMDILNHNKNCGIKTKMLYDVLVKSQLVSVLNIPTTRL